MSGHIYILCFRLTLILVNLLPYGGSVGVLYLYYLCIGETILCTSNIAGFFRVKLVMFDQLEALVLVFNALTGILVIIMGVTIGKFEVVGIGRL